MNSPDCTGLHQVRVGDLTVSYRSAGHGHSLILLHGFLCDSRCWQSQLNDLSDQFRIVAWDTPGAGGSSDPPESFTMTHWGHCLAGFLDALGIDRASLVGLSWGGILAQEFFRLYPTRVTRLVLADTYAGWKGSLTKAACEQRLVRCERDSLLPPKELAARWVDEMFSPAPSREVVAEMSGVIADFHPPGFRAMARSSAVTDTTELLPRIDIPTLLLWGDSDQRSPVRIGEQFRDAIPGAQLALIRNAGHLSNMEQPDRFNALVRRFCSSPGGHSLLETYL